MMTILLFRNQFLIQQEFNQQLKSRKKLNLLSLFMIANFIDLNRQLHQRVKEKYIVAY